MLRFIANRRAGHQFAQSADMHRYMTHVADAGADEVERRRPSGFRGGAAIEITGDTELGSDGWQAVVRAQSPFWHLPEFGGGRSSPRPYLRPGVQAILARVGGRWRAK